MSSVHITTMDGNEVTALLHFAIPATNNAEGVPWRTIAARFFGTTRMPDGDGNGGTISAAEKADIISGAVVEQEMTFKLTAFPTNAQITAQHTASQTAFLAAMTARYNRYGKVV